MCRWENAYSVLQAGCQRADVCLAGTAAPMQPRARLCGIKKAHPGIWMGFLSGCILFGCLAGGENHFYLVAGADFEYAYERLDIQFVRKPQDDCRGRDSAQFFIQF